MLGRLFGLDNERFAMTINLAGPGTAFQLAQLQDMTEDCRAFFVSPGASISPAAVLEEVKFATILPSGLYASEPSIIPVVGSGQGQGAGGTPPAQVACAVSLVTARRGPSGKGRFFVPIPTLDLGLDGRMTEARRDNLQAAAATFLNNIRNSPGVGGPAPLPIVASGKGFNTVVTGVRVGRVYDTIRSRRTSILEEHQPPTAVA